MEFYMAFDLKNGKNNENTKKEKKYKGFVRSFFMLFTAMQRIYAGASRGAEQQGKRDELYR